MKIIKTLFLLGLFIQLNMNAQPLFTPQTYEENPVEIYDEKPSVPKEVQDEEPNTFSVEDIDGYTFSFLEKEDTTLQLGYFDSNNAFTKPFDPDLIKKINLNQQWNQPIFLDDYNSFYGYYQGKKNWVVVPERLSSFEGITIKNNEFIIQWTYYFTFGIENQSKWAKIVALVQVVEKKKSLELRFIGEKNPCLTNNLETFNSYLDTDEKNVLYFFFPAASEAASFIPNLLAYTTGRGTLPKGLFYRDFVTQIVFQNFVMGRQ